MCQCFPRFCSASLNFLRNMTTDVKCIYTNTLCRMEFLFTFKTKKPAAAATKNQQIHYIDYYEEGNAMFVLNLDMFVVHRNFI